MVYNVYSMRLPQVHKMCVYPYKSLDLSPGVGVDGQPSLLVLRLDVRVLGCQRVLHLQTSCHSGHLRVPWVSQHLGQLHQECGLVGEVGRNVCYES